MAAATDSPNTNASTTRTTVANRSPRHSVASDNSNQPLSSPCGGTAVSPPWTQIVSDIAATPSSPSAAVAIEQTVAVSASSSASSMAEDEGLENGNGSNSNAGKKVAWNKPSNGAVDMGLVMGSSWPALSESARPSLKSSLDSLKGFSDGASSPSISEGTGNASSPSQKQFSSNANVSSTPNHTSRQRSMKRNGAGTSSYSSGTTQQTGLQGPTGEAHLNNPSPRDHAQRSSQFRGTNDQQQQQRNSFRNRNSGPHSRGDGFHSHNYGNRRDHDRGYHDGNTHRNFNGRGVVPRFMRHPPPPPPPPLPTSTFIPLSQVRPFVTPMGFPEFPSPVYYVAAPTPDSIRGVTYVPAPISPHAVFSPSPDFQLHSRIVNQIDYYFSNENLIKDTFLRQNMDDQGWVPIKLIAGFKKVSLLTDNIQFILNAVRSSTVVEVQGDKVRRQNDWMRWIMPPSVKFPNVSGSQSPLGNSSQDMLSNHFHSLSLDEISSHSNVRSQADVNAETYLSRSTSGDLSCESQQSISEEMRQVSVQGGLDHPISARNAK